MKNSRKKNSKPHFLAKRVRSVIRIEGYEVEVIQRKDRLACTYFVFYDIKFRQTVVPSTDRVDI